MDGTFEVDVYKSGRKKLF